MIEIKNYSVLNLENAIRGARNPMNSWDKSDSYYNEDGAYILGTKDLDLARRLCKAGSDHRKFMRQIIVSADITAPLYWWKEYDTYKVGTVSNSTSTMHKVHANKISLEDFSTDMMSKEALGVMGQLVDYLEVLRLAYVDTKDKAYWNDLIQLLPSSYNQLRTCTLNYETLINIYHSRQNHKLHEWHWFCAWIDTLPYADKLITI